MQKIGISYFMDFIVLEQRLHSEVIKIVLVLQHFGAQGDAGGSISLKMQKVYISIIFTKMSKSIWKIIFLKMYPPVPPFAAEPYKSNSISITFGCNFPYNVVGITKILYF